MTDVNRLDNNNLVNSWAQQFELSVLYLVYCSCYYLLLTSQIFTGVLALCNSNSLI